MSSSEWTFCVCLLTCLLNWSVSGDQQITVKTGDDVTLQCLDHRGGDIELLVWNKLEKNVFVWKHGKMSKYSQHTSFKNRVKLRDPEMKDGDVSVILKNVNIYDTGTYECYVRNSNTKLISNINLKVIGSGGVAGYTKDGEDKDGGDIDRVKSVQPGGDVLLPCQGPRGADIVFVKWIRPDLESEGSVFFFRDDRTYENYQHPSFHGRVELRDPQMKDGDASVILKNININDTGTYECYVRVKGNSPQLISSVHLKVKDSNQQITVKTGHDVTLQCLDPRGGGIELLEWSKPDLKSQDYVYYFRDERSDKTYQHPSFSGRVELRDPQMKDGDVSVILRNISINDTGKYECYVGYGGRSDLISTITLTVTDSGGGAGDISDGGDKDEDLALVVVLSVVSVLVLLGFVVGNIMTCRKYKSLKMQRYQLPTDKAADYKLQDLTPEPEEKMKEEAEETPLET